MVPAFFFFGFGPIVSVVQLTRGKKVLNLDECMYSMGRDAMLRTRPLEVLTTVLPPSEDRHSESPLKRPRLT